MRRTAFAALLVFSLALGQAALAFAQQSPAEPLSPADVVLDQKRYDGEIVRVTGEAIGEALRADAETVWVNVLGDGLLLGTVIDRGMASEIRTYGDYGHRGDEIVVTGQFHISCEEHSGETDIHVTDLQILRRGEAVEHPVPWTQLVVGMAAVAAAAVLGVLYRRREHQVPTGN